MCVFLFFIKNDLAVKITTNMQKDTNLAHLTIEHDARIANLEEKFESHAERLDRNLENILREVKELNTLYHKERNHFLEKISYLENGINQKINKIYASIIVGGLGVVWQLVWQILVNKKVI